MATKLPHRRCPQPDPQDARPEMTHGRLLACDWLKHRIVSIELLPGSTIDEAGLVHMLGVLRTPLRKAIGRVQDRPAAESRCAGDRDGPRAVPGTH